MRSSRNELTKGPGGRAIYWVLIFQVVNSVCCDFNSGPLKEQSLEAYGKDTLFIGPVTLLSSWKDADPGLIDCKTIGRRTVDRVDLPITKMGLIWSGHNTYTVGGFICIGKRRTIQCSRSFFGTDSLEQTEVNYVPTVGHCLDAYKRFSEHHTEFEGYPTPNCHWLSTSTARVDFVHIEATSSQYDTFRGGYSDHLLAGGRCLEAPCLLSTKDGYWINTTHPTEKCMFGDPVEFKMSAEYTDENLSLIQFLSLSVMATDFREACRSTLCEREGFRLSTGEWVSFNKVENLTLPACATSSLEVKRFTSEAVLRHMVNEVNLSQDYQKCKQLKTKMMENNTISRYELALLRPSVTGSRPVYRIKDGKVMVAKADYQVISRNIDSEFNSVGTFGTILSTRQPAVWTEARRLSSMLVDGPNGMFWFKGLLVDPQTWEGSLPDILKEISDPYLGTKADSLEEHRDSVNLSRWDDKVDLKLVQGLRWSLWIGLGAIVGLIVLILFLWFKCKIGLCKRTQVPKGQFFRA